MAEMHEKTEANRGVRHMCEISACSASTWLMHRVPCISVCEAAFTWGGAYSYRVR